MINNKLVENIKLIWNFLTIKRKRELLFIQILIFISAISEAVTLGFINFYLDIFVNSNNQSSEYFNLNLDIPESKKIIFYGSTLIFLIFLSALLRISTIFTQYQISSRLTFDIGTQVFKNILKRPYRWHLKVNSGFINGLLSNDVERVRDSIQYFLSFFNNLIILILISLTLLRLSTRFVLILLILIGIMFLLLYKLSINSLERDGKKSSKNYIDALRSITESKGSIKDIIIQNNHNFFVFKYREKLKKYLQANAQNQIKYNIPRFIVEGFILSGIIFLTIIIYLFSEGDEGNIPLYGTVLIGIYRLLQPAQQCFVSSAVIKANSASWANIKDYLVEDEKPFLETKISNLENKKVSNNCPLIKLENLSFRFDSSAPWIIKNLNLKLKTGSKIGFVGQTGSGKTTCADIIAGLLKPTLGNIYINGENLYNMEKNLKKWQNSLAHVPQDIYLLEDNFINNIAFGVPKENIDINRVIWASKKACLHDLIISNKKGYDQLIGERGKLLSGSQVQRLAIARAFYKKAKIIIFDEATSALDNLTEEYIMNSIYSLEKKITLIFIAHRISTIKKCDSIAFFDKECVYFDSFQNLYNKKLEFRNLVDKKRD